MCEECEYWEDLTFRKITYNIVRMKVIIKNECIPNITKAVKELLTAFGISAAVMAGLAAGVPVPA